MYDRFFGFGLTENKALVKLGYFSFLYLIVHYAKRFRIFGGNHKPLRVFVYAVAKRGNKRIFLFGRILPFSDKICDNMIRKSVKILFRIRLAYQACGFIDYENVLVLVNDFERYSYF